MGVAGAKDHVRAAEAVKLSDADGDGDAAAAEVELRVDIEFPVMGARAAAERVHLTGVGAEEDLRVQVPVEVRDDSLGVAAVQAVLPEKRAVGTQGHDALLLRGDDDLHLAVAVEVADG